MGGSSTNGVAAQRASKGGHILEKGSEGRDGRAAFHCPYTGATAQLTHCSLPATYTCDASGVWRSEELGTALPSCRPGTGGDGYHGERCGDVRGGGCLPDLTCCSQAGTHLLGDRALCCTCLLQYMAERAVRTRFRKAEAAAIWAHSAPSIAGAGSSQGQRTTCLVAPAPGCH